MGLFKRIFKKNKKPIDHEIYLKDEYRSNRESEKEPIIEIVDLKSEPTSQKKSAPKKNPTENTPEGEKTQSAPKKSVANTTPDKKSASKASSKLSETQTAEAKNAPKGFFEIKKSKDGRYVFNLYASNKVIVATSQVYTTSQNALAGVKSVITNAPKANIEDSTVRHYETLPYPKWEIYRDKIGEYRFRLSASNGSCVCHSQGYTTKSACKNGIASIIRTAKTANIDKAYLIKTDK